MTSRRWVLGAALTALLVRLLGLLRPVRADEAGFTLVARAWDAMPGSVYGPYFVDRPPSLIALFGLTDAVGGPLFIRVLGAVAGAALVLLAAWVARLVSSPPVPVALVAAALVTTPVIDAVAVKGELLALPLVLAAIGLALRADSARWALAAGLLAGLPLGFKQNLVGGVVFVLLLLLLRRPRLLPVALVGAVLPVLATIGWALAAGVRLHTLWPTPSTASAPMPRPCSAGAPDRPCCACCSCSSSSWSVAPGCARDVLRGLGEQWRGDRALTVAIVAMLAVDVASLLAGGSFWRDYLFPLAARRPAVARPRSEPWPAAGSRPRRRLLAGLPGRLGRLQPGRPAGVRRARHRRRRGRGRRSRRHPRGLRRPGRPPARERARLAVRLPVVPAHAHPRPGPHRARRRARRTRRPHLDRRVGRVRHLGRAPARACRPRSSSATSSTATAAATGRSGCCAGSRATYRPRTATADARFRSAL